MHGKMEQMRQVDSEGIVSIEGSSKYLRSFVIIFALSFLIGCNSDEEPEILIIPGIIDTWAGTGLAGFDGDGQPLLKSKFYWPVDVTVAPSGAVYILDWNNHRVRVTTSQMTLQTVIGTDFVGDGDFEMLDLVKPGAPGTTINLNHPTHLLPLSNGTFILTAWHNHKLRSYDPVTGMVFVVCGSNAGFSGDGSQSLDALLSQPSQTVVDSEGSFYILDQRNQRIRKIDESGIISTVVGNGVARFSGDGGPPLQAQINMPGGGNPPPAGAIAFDQQGRLYISDALNNRIRQVDFGQNIIETVAGNGDQGFSGDNGLAIEASFNNPRDIVFGPDGRLYVADEFNHRIRAIDLTTGIITTIAGNGQEGFSGDGGLATEASLNRPAGLDFDAEGYLYIADTYNHRIRRITP